MWLLRDAGLDTDRRHLLTTDHDSSLYRQLLAVAHFRSRWGVKIYQVNPYVTVVFNVNEAASADEHSLFILW